MTSLAPLDRARTAILIMDYQAGIVTSHPGDQEALLARANAVLAAARAAQLPVIYVVVAFRAGHPEIGPGNLLFSGLKQTGRFAAGDPGVEIHPAVAPHAGDVVVTKRRVSAFAGSDLELLLRARGLDTLVLFGIATSGVVLSTVRQAADADYRLIVLDDLCADRDAEVHRVLVEKIFPRQAEVTTADAFLAGLHQQP
jgi:nicotinamidase-related amidase